MALVAEQAVDVFVRDLGERRFESSGLEGVSLLLGLLHDLIEDDEIRRVFAAKTEPEAIVAALIDAANQAGGIDNITCLIASLPSPAVFPMLRARAARLLAATRSLFPKSRAQ